LVVDALLFRYLSFFRFREGFFGVSSFSPEVFLLPSRSPRTPFSFCCSSSLLTLFITQKTSRGFFPRGLSSSFPDARGRFLCFRSLIPKFRKCFSCARRRICLSGETCVALVLQNFPFPSLFPLCRRVSPANFPSCLFLSLSSFSSRHFSRAKRSEFASFISPVVVCSPSFLPPTVPGFDPFGHSSVLSDLCVAGGLS